MSVNLSETSLVDELGNGASGWVSVSDVWLNSSQQSGGGLVDSNEDGVVDLSESEQLEDLLFLWCNGIDTLSSDDKEDLWFGRNVDLAGSLGGSDLLDDGLLVLLVSLMMSLSSLEPVSLEGLDVLSASFSVSLQLVFPLLGSLLLLLQGLWNWSPTVKP